MTEVMCPRVCSVVVTFNRIDLLKRCIDGILYQTIPCDLIIINNASSDGTQEWLMKRSMEEQRIHVYNLSENLGGAGGFATGISIAQKMKYSHIWLMDDDTIPEPSALEELLKTDKMLEGNYGWLSSRALWTDGSQCRMNIQRKTPYTDILDFSKPVIPAQMASFVSLFLKTETIRTYGIPLKEFFIWADDWEYTRRISCCLRCYVSTKSIVTHAMAENSIVNIATDRPERLPRYRYAYRNDVYLYRREGLKGWLWLIAKDAWHMLQVLFHSRTNKYERIKVIANGFLEGVHFFPVS